MPDAIVTVVIPAYQVADFIAETLESISGQTISNWKAIIVDDGSTDGLREVVSQFLTDDRFHLISISNSGVAAARNVGIAESKTKYIAFLDGDDKYDPAYLEEMVGALEGEGDAVLACCDVNIFDDKGSSSRLFSSTEKQIPPITLERVISREFTIPIMCVIRRDVLESLGRFDSRLRAAEDFDLWTRLLAAGHKATYVAKPLVWYRRRAGSLSNTPDVFRSRIAAVYLERMYEWQNTPLAVICRRYVYRQLASLDEWEGEQALREGRWREAREKLRRAARVSDKRGLKVIAALCALSPKLARLVVNQMKQASR